jgi:transcriptional regulator with XRE-family HTH domain
MNFLQTHFGALVAVKLVETQQQQQEIARRANISPSYMSDIVNGKRIPPLETALAIGDAMGLHPHVVCYVLGVLPPEFVGQDVTEQAVIEAYACMRDRLH